MELGVGITRTGGGGRGGKWRQAESNRDGKWGENIMAFESISSS